MIGLKYLLISFAAIVSFSTGVLILKNRPRRNPNAALSIGSFLTSAYLIVLLFVERNLDAGRPPVPWLNIFQALICLIVWLAPTVSAVLPQAVEKFKKVIIPYAYCGAAITALSLVGPSLSDYFVVRSYSELFFKTGFSYAFDFYLLFGQILVLVIIRYQYIVLNSGESSLLEKRIVRTLMWWVLVRGLIFWGSFWILVKMHEAGGSEKPFIYLNALGVLITMSIFIYVVVRHKAFDLETVIHKTFSWLALSSVPIAIAAVGAFWLDSWLTIISPWQRAAILGGIGAIFGLYLYTAQPYVDQLFDRRKYNLQKALDRIIGELAILQELQPMAQKILERVATVLSVQGAAALVLGSPQELALAAKEDIDTKDRISLPSAVQERLQGGSMLRLDRNQGMPHAKEEDPTHSWLKEQKFALCLPLVQKEELIGVIALGRKRNLKRFSPRETAFLTRLGAAATIAFQNSLLFEEVRKLDRLKTEFLSQIAHELRGPLLGMAVNAEGLLAKKGGSVPDDHRRLIEGIRVAAVEMKELVDHLLDLSKIEMGVMTFHFQQVDVGGVIRLAVDLAAGAIASKGLDLAVDIEDPLPLLYIDKARIRQCVTNLLLNAVKYTDQGSIRVSARATDEEITINVEDTGRGMSKEEIEVVFERYMRGRRVEAIEGSGLGLALTKEIVEAHQGRIEMESGIGQGTKVAMVFPGNQAGEAQSAVASPVRRRSFVDGSDQTIKTSPSKETLPILPNVIAGNSETLLVVDDSDTDREVLQSFFEANGYRVLTATNGMEALELIRLDPPSLIITDMVMPNISGPRLCRILREALESAAIPIIMVTARDNLGDTAFEFRFGADDYAPKPYNLKELSLRVATLLRISRIRKDLDTAKSRLIEMELIASSSGTFVHAIKNPIALIENNVRLVRAALDRSNHQKVDEGLAHIEESARTISRILQGLRRAHLEPPKMARVDLRDVIEACLSELIWEGNYLKYRVIRRYANEIPPVQGDAYQLGMALSNLVSNALEAMPEGGVLEIALFAPNPATVQVEIKDSGAGIPDGIRSNLFKPFITTKADGTGLGLWTAKRIIETHHGGRLTLDSSPTDGTTAKASVPSADKVPVGRRAEIKSDGKQPYSDR